MARKAPIALHDITVIEADLPYGHSRCPIGGFCHGAVPGQIESDSPPRAITKLRPQSIELSPLTRRQRQVLRQMALGLVTKEIAYQLHLSPKTVAAHRMHIMERLDIHDLAGLVIYALRKGLVGLDDYEQRRGQR